MTQNLTFSAGLHDGDGDLYDSGVFLHMQNGVLLRFDDADALEAFARDRQLMLPELRERCSNRR